MKDLKEIITARMPEKVAKPAPHELSATVNLIEAAGLFEPKYGRGYWLGKVKKAEISFTEMHGILKEISSMPKKYSRGGRLTNVLSTRAKALKDHGKQ